MQASAALNIEGNRLASMLNSSIAPVVSGQGRGGCRASCQIARRGIRRAREQSYTYNKRFYRERNPSLWPQ
jgi:hypothetical protein